LFLCFVVLHFCFCVLLFFIFVLMFFSFNTINQPTLLRIEIVMVDNITNETWTTPRANVKHQNTKQKCKTSKHKTKM
jgi:hypothetical protein